MASLGACKLFSPSATEAASLKVSIKQGFYLKMQRAHTLHWTLWKPPCYKLWLSLSPVWPCTAVWARGQVPLTQKLLLPPNLLDGKTHHWCQLWKSFRLLANRSCKTNKLFAKWCVATTGPRQHSNYCSLEKEMLFLPLAASQLSKSLLLLGSFWVWNGIFLRGLSKLYYDFEGKSITSRFSKRDGGRENQAAFNPLVKYGGSGWKFGFPAGVSWAAVWSNWQF